MFYKKLFLKGLRTAGPFLFFNIPLLINHLPVATFNRLLICRSAFFVNAHYASFILNGLHSSTFGICKKVM